MGATAEEQQERFAAVISVIRSQLKIIEDDAHGTLTLDREQAEALIDCIDLVEAVRVVTVARR